MNALIATRWSPKHQARVCVQHAEIFNKQIQVSPVEEPRQALRVLEVHAAKDGDHGRSAFTGCTPDECRVEVHP